MIISRTPFRISFFGGGTDYPTWFLKNGGAVLSTSFDKYCYITSRELPPFFDHNYRIAYSVVENTNTIEEIKHPAIRAVLNELNLKHGLEIHADADLPARSGLGSSSSFVVGLLHSLSILAGLNPQKKWLADEAIRIEQNVLKENVGCQDQIAASFGGFNIIKFNKDGSYKIEGINLPNKRREALNNNLMLFFTGFSRFSSEVAKSKLDNFAEKEVELNKLSEMVNQAVEILSSETDLRSFGELLHDSWIIKRELSDKVTTHEIDHLYEKAIRAGAIGGKLLGAGGGGFMLLFVEPEKQLAVKIALNNLVYVPFKFESLGSQLIYKQF